MRSSPEWAASERIPRLPVEMPTTAFRAVMPIAATTELAATARFSARIESGVRMAGPAIGKIIAFPCPLRQHALCSPPSGPLLLNGGEIHDLLQNLNRNAQVGATAVDEQRGRPGYPYGFAESDRLFHTLPGRRLSRAGRCSFPVGPGGCGQLRQLLVGVGLRDVLLLVINAIHKLPIGSGIFPPHAVGVGCCFERPIVRGQG